MGQLDQRALELSLVEIVRRHEILRTVFPDIHGAPVQVVLPADSLDLEFKDLGSLPRLQRQAEAKRIAARETQEVFDLGKGPLLRAVLFRLEKDEHVLLLLMHHIVFDGWSESILLQELSTLYEAFSGEKGMSPLPELPIQYADFAAWQHRQLIEGALDEHLSHWKQQLQGLPALPLQTDSPRTNALNSQGASQSIVLPLSLTEQLKELGRRERVTLFMTLLTVFQVLLSRYTGQEDFAVGVPVAGRTHLQTEGLIGCFMNVLVLRAALAGNPSFCEALHRVRQAALEAYAHQAVPFEKLVEELRPERSPDRWPLFQVMFNMRNLPTAPVTCTANLRLEPFPFDSGLIGGLDLSLEVVDRPDGLHCVFSYPSVLFRADTISRMTQHFRILLRGMAANPGQPVWTLPVLTESELRQQLVELNNTRRDYPKDVCIHELFESQVRRTPDAVAVICEDKQLTYRELNCRSNQLAHYLRRHGVGPEVLVGICAEQSVEMLIGLLGILKAGGAYVPLDPTYPQERLEFILTDTETSVVLTQRSLLERLPSTPTHEPGSVRRRVICLDIDQEAISQESKDNPVRNIGPSNLAYIIYTSGSTGIPKGVMACHGAVCNYLLWRCEYFPLTQHDRLLQRASVSFDDSVWEFFEPLTVGASLIITESYSRQDVSYLIRLISRYKITAACFVPSMLQTLLEHPDVETCRHLRRVTTGAESLSVELKDCFFNRLAADLYNGYGTTECTIAATFWACNRSTNRRVLIGKPIANTKIYLLDSHLNPVPVGVPGEIHIGGAGLARGYLNRPDLTAEKFIPNPFGHEPGERLYRTGDQARYQPDGNIEFLGRMDHQVKIRGFRIELEEIEAVLAQHPGVEEAAVNVAGSGPYDKRLVAYVVPNRTGSLTIDDLRHFLKKKVPLRMIPSVFVLLERLPRSPSGKIDRQALPLPNEPGLGSEKTYVAPQNALEEMLASLWSDVLGLSQVGVKDNFFDLGGHSLLATRLMSRVRAALRVNLSLRDLFENPTIGELAAVITARQAEGADQEDVAHVLTDVEALSDEEVERLLAEENP